MSRRFTYELYAKDGLSSKLRKISNISTSTYNKLIGGQQKFNEKLSHGSARAGSLTGKLKGMIGTYLTLGAGVMFANNSLKKWDNQMQAQAQTMQGIQSTNMAAGRSFEQLTKAASQFQKKTLFGDEAILQGVTSQLLTFTNITRNEFDRTQQAVLDFTTRLYGAKATSDNLRATSLMLGKALNDPVSNLGALSRSGFQVSESQEQMIKDLWKSGETAKAQSIILNELQKQYGGSAEAAAKTGLGPWKQFLNAIGDIQETLGPALFKITILFKNVFDWIKSNIEIIKPLVTVVGSAIAAYYAWIGVMKIKAALLAGYKALQFGIIAITKGWTAAQMTLNGALTANPIGLIIAGIAALGAAIYGIIKKTKGWGDQWQNFKAVVSNVWERLKLKFQSWVGNLSLLWQKFKKLIGLGNDENIAKTEAKLQNIGNKLNSLKNNAPSLEWKLKWDKEAKIMPDWMQKFIGGGDQNQAFTGGINQQLAGSGNTSNMNNVLSSEVTKGINSITSGGKKQTIINVTLGKLQEYTQINATNVEAGIDELEDKVTEALLRVLNSANKIATQ